MKNKVEVQFADDGVPYQTVSAGAYFQVLDANDKDMIGYIGRKPYTTGESTIVFNQLMGSTDRNLGIRRVRVLQPGDSFTVTIE